MHRIQRGLTSAAPRPRASLLGSQRTFAVTDAPSRNASWRAEMVCAGPPSLEKRCVRRRPGKRSEGETKIIWSEGSGLTNMY